MFEWVFYFILFYLFLFFYFLFYILFILFYLFLERGTEVGERERGLLSAPLLGTWPATQAYMP